MDFLSWNDTVKLAFLIMMTGITFGTVLFLMFTLWLGVKRQSRRSSDKELEKIMLEEKDK
jgi:hypothetical protein